MTDKELVDVTKPPQALAKAFLEKDEEGIDQLLELLFACHKLVDDPGQEYGLWYECDVAWPLKRLYGEERLTKTLWLVAPSWEKAIDVSAEWLKTWGHNCAEYECWAYRRDEWHDPSPLAFFKEMLVGRLTEKLSMSWLPHNKFRITR